MQIGWKRAGMPAVRHAQTDPRYATWSSARKAGNHLPAPQFDDVMPNGLQNLYFPPAKKNRPRTL
jgi:hypothetical protein